MAFIDFLEIVSPDYYDEYLVKSANFDLPLQGAYKQVRNETDGDNPKVVTLKTTPEATVTIRFTGVSQAEADDLSDLYYNPLKAYGMARSYIWQHSQTLDYYTVQNVSEFSQTATIMSFGRYDISFTVKILGIPGLTVGTSGQTVNFGYAGTASFITKYPDDTESLLTNPPEKDFGYAEERKTIVLAYEPSEVTTFDLGANNISIISAIKSYTALSILYLQNNDLTESPDLTTNTDLTILHLNDNDLTESPDLSNNTLLEELLLQNNELSETIYFTNNTALTDLEIHYNNLTAPPIITTNTALTILFLHFNDLTSSPDVANHTNLEYLYINDNNITEVSLSFCVGQLYVNRVALGANSCVIKLENNNGLTADAIAKIEGTGAYSGDGLKDNGCTVTY